MDANRKNLNLEETKKWHIGNLGTPDDKKTKIPDFMSSGLRRA
jgi:hypothetical protein